jgi:excisionase family DNA binding protein
MYLTLAQVAERLQVSIDTVRYWRRTRPEFPAVRLGRVVRVKETDLDAWIERLRELEAVR